MCVCVCVCVLDSGGERVSGAEFDSRSAAVQRPAFVRVHRHHDSADGSGRGGRRRATAARRQQDSHRRHDHDHDGGAHQRSGHSGPARLWRRLGGDGGGVTDASCYRRRSGRIDYQLHNAV